MLKLWPLVLVLLSTSSWAAVPACKQPDGYAIGLVVPTPDAAKRVYEAVATGRYDQIKSSNDILVNDRGDHWEVFQYPKKAPSFERHSDGSETVTVVAGGGTLELEITKCDGRIIGSYAR